MSSDVQATFGSSLVTVKMLESWLAQAYNTDEKIQSFDCTEIGDQKGYMSIVRKLDLTYSGKKMGFKLPSALIIKSPTITKIEANIAASPKLAEFFGHEMLQRQHNVEIKAYKLFSAYGSGIPIPMPRCLYLEEITPDNKGLIVMEYIDGKSLSFNDDWTPGQVDELTKHIAKLQAFGHERSNVRDAFSGLDPSFWGPAFKDSNLIGSMVKLQQDFPEILNYSKDVIEKAAARLKTNRYKLTSPRELAYPPVLAFGDSQPNNILFKPNSDGTISDEVAAFLDFQLMHVGSPFYDLSAILFWGVDHHSVGHTIERMLTLYHDLLTDPTNGKMFFSLESLKTEFKDFYPVFLAMYLPWVATLLDIQNLVGMSEARIKQFVIRVKPVYETGT